MSIRSTPTRLQLARIFRGATVPSPRIGIELEYGIVEPETGRSVSYGEPRGSRSLLARLTTELAGVPVLEEGVLVGTRLPSGATFSLELGGALEYSSAPYPSLAQLVEDTRRDVGRAAEVAGGMGQALLPAGMLPFTPVNQIPWIPKTRVEVMRRFFRRLGPSGSSADQVMGLALSTQTTLDYLSGADLLEKFRLLVTAAPVAAAIFVNSPLEAGNLTGYLSTRMHRWERVDPQRCGVLHFALDSVDPATDMVEWALRRPMIYRVRNGRAEPAPARPFARLIDSGFGDGTYPSLDDWDCHLSQVWPHVRLRRTLEVRLLDGLDWPVFAAAPALWTGLAYDEGCRREALALLAAATAADLVRLTREVGAVGLSATLLGEPVSEVASQLVELADRGLRRRVAERLEPAWVPSLLDPLREVLATKVTYAERCLYQWSRSLRHSPAAFVRAYRV